MDSKAAGWNLDPSLSFLAVGMSSGVGKMNSFVRYGLWASVTMPLPVSSCSSVFKFELRNLLL